MNKTILITGGVGFVGSSLASYLKHDYPDSSIILFDNLRRRGSELNIRRMTESGLEFIHGDIRCKEDLRALKHIDLLIDCAAEPSVLAGYNNEPEYILNTNLQGTINCLELARNNNAGVIFISTSRVYPIKQIQNIKYNEEETRLSISDKQSIRGVSGYGISEEFPLDGARSLYGTSKLASEMILQEYIDMYDIKGVVNRCGVLTGPWQMGKVDQGVIALWVAKHIYGGELSYIGYQGTGKQVRDILHVNDLYKLIKLQLENLEIHNGQTYNVGGGVETSLSLYELTKYCEEIIGRQINITKVTENRVGDIPCYISDCRKVTSSTGWKPSYSVKEVIEDVANWIYENKEILKPMLS